MGSDPGTLTPVTKAVAPGGTSALSRTLPVAGVPAVVVSLAGDAVNGSTAEKKAGTTLCAHDRA